MTLDYTKMFLIVTEEAVVKGHFTYIYILYIYGIAPGEGRFFYSI